MSLMGTCLPSSYNSDSCLYHNAPVILMIEAREILKVRESALTDWPLFLISMICERCCSVVLSGRPNVLPWLFALASPACVRSINKSRSIAATADNMVSMSFPAGEVRSSCPSWITNTLILRSARFFMVERTSWASRPSRSSFVTIKVSPFLIWPSNALNWGRCEAWELPLTPSSYPSRIVCQSLKLNLGDYFLN